MNHIAVTHVLNVTAMSYMCCCQSHEAGRCTVDLAELSHQQLSRRSSALHSRAFGTPDWGSHTQPSGQQPHSKQKKVGSAPLEPVSVHVGPLSEANRRIQQQQEQQQQQTGARFLKANSFAGAKTGYVFKTGPNGLGYYLEAAHAIAVNQKQAAIRSKQSQAETAGASADAGQVTHSSTDAVEEAEDMQPAPGESQVIAKANWLVCFVTVECQMLLS